MKRLLLLFFCFCMSCMAWAIDYQLVIDFTDGTEVTFALSRQPVLSFADQNLCVSVEGESSQFELADVANFHFKEDPSAIRSPHTDNDLRIVWQGEDVIVIPLAASDTQIRLYGLDGTYYPSRVNVDEDRQVVSLSGLPKGIYLLYINHRTLKINRK